MGRVAKKCSQLGINEGEKNQLSAYNKNFLSRRIGFYWGGRCGQQAQNEVKKGGNSACKVITSHRNKK